ncbi:sulfite exporter TauE/SafE family protein [Rhodobacteraceae bacterium M385]|nr:sulfite exporter TauE/SafE family protein [Rhodobacteraceae bacterium M385]
MPEALTLALQTPGLEWVICAGFLAALVYGFAGFGSALIFMPLATIFMPPPLAIAAFSLSALGSLVTVFPGAWKSADKGQTLMVVAMSIVFMPVGIFLLRIAPEVTIRTAVCVVTLLTLVLLVSGWKVPLRGGRGLQLGVGALAGITGGSTGLNGPPVILFNLGTDQPVAVTRGNLACFLTLNSLFMMPLMWAQGLVDARAFFLGLILLLPYALGGFVGVQLFRPGGAALYRTIAFVLIGVAGVMGLPIWG